MLTAEDDLPAPPVGNKTAYIPGGARTGAPGKHVIGGKAKFRIIDEKVRVYIAPPLEELDNTALKPYVSMKVRLTPEQKLELYGPLPKGGFDGKHYVKMMREKEEQERERKSWSLFEPAERVERVESAGGEGSAPVVLKEVV